MNDDQTMAHDISPPLTLAERLRQLAITEDNHLTDEQVQAWTSKLPPPSVKHITHRYLQETHPSSLKAWSSALDSV